MDFTLANCKYPGQRWLWSQTCVVSICVVSICVQLLYGALNDPVMYPDVLVVNFASASQLFAPHLKGGF